MSADSRGPCFDKFCGTPTAPRAHTAIGIKNETGVYSRLYFRYIVCGEHVTSTVGDRRRLFKPLLRFKFLREREPPIRVLIMVVRSGSLGSLACMRRCTSCSPRFGDASSYAHENTVIALHMYQFPSGMPSLPRAISAITKQACDHPKFPTTSLPFA